MWVIKSVFLQPNLVTVKEMNLLIDEVVRIIYDELIKKWSSPNDFNSSNKTIGGCNVSLNLFLH